MRIEVSRSCLRAHARVRSRPTNDHSLAWLSERTRAFFFTRGYRLIAKENEGILIGSVMVKVQALWFGRAGLCLALAASRHASAEPAARFAADTQPQAATAVAPAPSPEALKEAAGRYTRGLSLYGDGEFLLALVEFERAYELSKNYKVLYNIGQVRIQLGRYAQGREALAEYLRLGGDNVSAERLAAVNKDLAMLVERTASLNIVASQPGADISLDGKVIGTSPLSAPLVVDAGEHSLGRSSKLEQARKLIAHIAAMLAKKKKRR